MKRFICRVRGHRYSRWVGETLWTTSNCLRCGYADPRPRCIRSIRDQDGSPLQCNLPLPCSWHGASENPTPPGTLHGGDGQ